MNLQTKLLYQMNEIVDALITKEIYRTDFTRRDTEFIQKTEAKTPFSWIVFDAGTHIYAMDSEQEVEKFSVILDHYEKYSYGDFYLYRYDGEKLLPAFPAITRRLTKSELEKKEAE